MYPNIVICPIKRLYQILQERGSEGAAAIISTSSDEPDAKRLLGIPYIFAVYRDIDYEGPGAFSDLDAARFAAFIKNLPSDTDTVFCCCDAGQSRSPGVGAAVSRHFGADATDTIWRNPNFNPNFLVFIKLCDKLGVPVDDDEADRLLYESRQSFQNAIAQARKQT